MSAVMTRGGPGDATAPADSMRGQRSRRASRVARKVSTVSMRGVVSGFAAAIGITIHPFHNSRCDRDNLAVTEIQWENSNGTVAPIRELGRRTLIRTNSRPEFDSILVIRKRPDVCVHAS